MRELDSQELTKEIQNLQIANASILSSIPIIHTLGYGLILLTTINSLSIAIPVNFFDSFWILSTLEQIIEQIPLALLGLILIFFGKNLYRDRLERKILKLLHSFALWLGVLLLFFIPLSIFNNVLINEWTQEKLALQVAKKMLKIEQIKEELNAIESESDLNGFVNLSLKDLLASSTAASERLDIKKYRIANHIEKESAKIADYSQQVSHDNAMRLTKHNIKSTLSFLVAGFLLIAIWRNSKWIEF
jgi:amino acid transporter